MFVGAVAAVAFCGVADAAAVAFSGVAGTVAFTFFDVADVVAMGVGVVADTVAVGFCDVVGIVAAAVAIPGVTTLLPFEAVKRGLVSTEVWAVAAPDTLSDTRNTGPPCVPRA